MTTENRHHIRKFFPSVSAITSHGPSSPSLVLSPSSSRLVTSPPSTTSTVTSDYPSYSHLAHPISSPLNHLRPSASAYEHLSALRGRRGRQARSSSLTPSMHKAVRRFSRSVGVPTAVPPAGFRDFRGWLIRLSSRETRPIWDQLIAAIAREVHCNVNSMNALKEDVVREIVKCVVVPRPDESAKLVSTNAGRQASRPRSGTTLMVVLDQQMHRVHGKLSDLVEEYYPGRLGNSQQMFLNHSHAQVTGREERVNSISSPQLSTGRSNDQWTQRHRQRSTHISARHSLASSTLSSSRLPSVQDLLNDKSERERDYSHLRTLPSFKELDASLRSGRSSQVGR